MHHCQPHRSPLCTTCELDPATVCTACHRDELANLEISTLTTFKDQLNAAFESDDTDLSSTPSYDDAVAIVAKVFAAQLEKIQTPGKTQSRPPTSFQNIEAPYNYHSSPTSEPETPTPKPSLASIPMKSFNQAITAPAGTDITVADPMRLTNSAGSSLQPQNQGFTDAGSSKSKVHNYPGYGAGGAEQDFALIDALNTSDIESIQSMPSTKIAAGEPVSVEGQPKIKLKFGRGSKTSTNGGVPGSEGTEGDKDMAHIPPSKKRKVEPTGTDGALEENTISESTSDPPGRRLRSIKNHQRPKKIEKG